MAKPQSATELKVAPESPPPALPLPPETEEPEKKKPKRLLPTRRIAVSKQLDILRGIVHASGQEGKAVRLDDIASIVGMHANTITVGNPFLADIGLILKGGGGFIPAADTIAYASHYDWNPDTAAHKLAPTIGATWFAKALMPKLSMRPMAESDAIADLATEAGAGKEYRPQLRMLLEFMDAAGLVTRENGRITKRSGTSPATDNGGGARPTEKPSGSEPDAPASQGNKSTLFTSFSQPTEGVIRFNVSVKVDMAEFAGWKPERIASFFGGIAQVLAAKGALEQDASGD